jgi:hypothetical protein
MFGFEFEVDSLLATQHHNFKFKAGNLVKT